MCGVDEAGRGPLAGPVVAAAVDLEPGQYSAGLNDSKKLGEHARNALFAEILAKAEVGVGLADVARIDEMNILHASMWAMSQAIADLQVAADHALIDGNRAPDTAGQLPDCRSAAMQYPPPLRRHPSLPRSPATAS